jgi:hypothetical protein
MAQSFSHTLIDAKSANGTYGLMTNQAQHVARTIYVTGPFTGTVSIEASPVDTGEDWHEVFSTTAVGAQNFTIDPLVCCRLRGKLASMMAGTVTVKIVSRYESN